MDYRGLVDALYGQSQFAIKYDLDAMRDAVERVNPGRLARRVVLVGGTNGKGGTCAHLNALGLAAGLRVGLYTSPHLVDFRERIRIGGLPMSEVDAARVGAPLFRRFSGRSAPPETPRALSYFELATLMAWVAFAEADLDLAVIEVGLGGRLDATNVSDPDVSIITSVSVDHEAWLGDTLDAIASEKTPIARAGRPAFVHRRAGGFDVLEPRLRALGADVRVLADGASPEDWSRGLAEAAFDALFPGLCSPETRARAAEGVAWPGRRHTVVRGGRVLLLDGAHNDAAAAHCAAWADRELGARHHGPAPIVLGVTGGRDPVTLARYLAPHASEFLAAAASAPSAMPADEVATRLRAGGFEARPVGDARAVLAALDRVPVAVATGSLYLVGDLLECLGYTAETLPVFIPRSGP